MTKRIACEFDNCQREFERHRSHTSFSALDAQFKVVADLMRDPIRYIGRLCDRHTSMVKEWLDGVLRLHDELRGGVPLVKITRR